MSHKEQVPEIQVVTEEQQQQQRGSSTGLNPTHSRKPSDPNYLTTPTTIFTKNPSSDDVPPSPTLSTSSVRFNTTTDLRNYPPGDGMASNPLKGSSAVSIDGTIPDHQTATGNSPPVSPSAATSITAAPPTSTTPPTSKHHRSAFRKKSKKSKQEDEENANGASGEKDVDGDVDPLAAAHVDPTKDTTDPTPFAFKPLALAGLLDPKSLSDLGEMGGTEGLCKGLGTDPREGLSAHSLGQSAAGGEKSGGEGAHGAALQDRVRVYGHNELPSRKSKTLLQLMWLAMKDKVLILLSVAAVISLALGLYQDFGVEHRPEPCPTAEDENATCIPARVDFVEGVAIMIAILIVVLVGSLNDWQKERQFRTLNDKKEDRSVNVIRAGKQQVINVKDVLVGDLALFEPGEIIPCDGVYVQGHLVRADESGATGESDAIAKLTYEEIMQEIKEKGSSKRDPFMISGSKILEGSGMYVVVAVGRQSFNGRIMMALSGDSENTPLQLKLNNLAELIAKIGGICGLILFSSLMIKFFVQLGKNPDRTPNEKAMNFVQILIISVTLVVVAVPEGLPLAVTLALAFATKRMTRENLLVRVLGSCETMANATVVCTDKTGTLTQNEMTVVAGSVGVNAKFVQNLPENPARTNAEDGERKYPEDFSIEQNDLNTILSPQLKHIFNEGIAVNSTAFEDVDKESGELKFVGSKTETALLRFAKELEWPAYAATRKAAKDVQTLPFASERKYMAVMVEKPGGGYRVYFKGASEILSKLCKRHVVVRPAGGQQLQGDINAPVETVAIDKKAEENIAATIIFYANQMLRTIALCYVDYDGTWPPSGKSADDAPLSDLAKDLTLIGIVGIEDPLRPSVREAVTDCARASVTIKMCTGDNVLTARSIASQCGIYTPGGIIMEGPAFRKLTPVEREQVVPRLQVLARSSPEDKKILVETLKGQGQVVGVTGDGTNDGPALKTANVGFSMGIAGTEVAKEASDIILMDDNFSSIVSAIIWGRCVNDAVRKFLQFQISVNITAVLITFISAVSSDEEESVLTAVQLLWINIIMDTFAALALATDRATRSLLDRKPDPKTAPLFTLDMGKMIIGQAVYQTIVILTFHFAGPSIFNTHGSPRAEKELSATIFNIFVFCQIFNSVNCRRIDRKYNIFEGMDKNWYFMAITLFEVVIQVLIMFFGGAAFSVTPINGRDWGISIAFGFVAIPLGAIIRTIPNDPIRRLLVHIRVMQDPNALPTSVDTDDDSPYGRAAQRVSDHLSIFRRIRGGRVSASTIGRNKSALLHKAGVQTTSLMAMAPGLLGAAVGVSWKKADGLHDPANMGDPSKSSAALWEGKVLLHPDTDPSDPAYKIWGRQLEKVPKGPKD